MEPAGISHIARLARQLWENDSQVYAVPERRVRLWAQVLALAFGGSRSGEVLESAARPNSGRGVYCKVSPVDGFPPLSTASPSCRH